MGWEITGHVCRFCFGRILCRETADGVTQYRCADCGQTGTGDVHSLCACGSGWAPKTKSRARSLVSLRTRCTPNPKHSPAPMGEPEIIAVEAD